MNRVAPSSLKTQVLPVFAAETVVPSGQSIDLVEVLVEEVASDVWVRFRYLAPEIGRGADKLNFADVEADFEQLCEGVALPYLREYALEADVVSISMMDRFIDFGDSDPETAQFVEVFRVTSGACVWEGL